MSAHDSRTTALWTTISDALDIPPSLYTKAADRHVAIGKFLMREGSLLRQFDPDVRPQGSFRFGTVIRPLDVNDEYDLDHVVVLHGIDPRRTTQQEVKALLGHELHLYAAQYGMSVPTEHNRCWRMPYRDEVGFHLDSLPTIPAGADFIAGLSARVDPRWASVAIAITDRTHPLYRVPSVGWRESNPRGFARWFESRAMLGRDPRLVDGIRAGTIEEVPTFSWRTPLQRAIQIMKRHRDVMFQRAPALKPISMIITNTAAHAYGGERDVGTALRNIVAGMPDFVRRVAPYVPNPTHPGEDYGDKWSGKPELMTSFFAWHQQLDADVERLSLPRTRIDPAFVRDHFAVDLSATQLAVLELKAPAVHVAPTASVTASTLPEVRRGPKPWAR